MPDGFGFIRSDNYMPGDSDVYVSPSQIRRFGLKTGDIIRGNTRVKSATEKFSALLYLKSVNNLPLDQIMRRGNFEDMTPVFPDERLRLERPGGSMAMRIVDLVSPIGKGQRGMIVSPPKAGKTTLLKDAAKSILRNNPEMYPRGCRRPPGRCRACWFPDAVPVSSLVLLPDAAAPVSFPALLPDAAPVFALPHGYSDYNSVVPEIYAH